MHYSQKGNVMLLGDFNTRTSKLEDFISKEGNTFINDTTDNSFIPAKRNNFDGPVNEHGKCLIELCKNCNLRILNARTLGDSLGKPTFHGKNGIMYISTACPGGTPPGHPGTLKKHDSNPSLPREMCKSNCPPPWGLE